MSTFHTLGFGHTNTATLGINQRFSTSSSNTSFYPSPRFQKTLSYATDVNEDNKDVLVERLNDLVQRLSRDHYLKDSVVSEIHQQVDNIERLIRDKASHRKPYLITGLGIGEGEQASDGPFLSRSRTFSSDMSILLPHSPPAQSAPPQKEAEMSPEVATRIVKEAGELEAQLSKSIAELRVRKEEIDYIHDLLVTRVEAGAKRNLFFEYRIAEMEDDFQANQSELQFLRIQLQAIEAQCTDYIPHSCDEELNESIKNWKIDWEDIDRRSKARRRKFQKSMGETSGNETPVLVSY